MGVRIVLSGSVIRSGRAFELQNTRQLGKHPQANGVGKLETVRELTYRAQITGGLVHGARAHPVLLRGILKPWKKSGHLIARAAAFPE